MLQRSPIALHKLLIADAPRWVSTRYIPCSFCQLRVTRCAMAAALRGLQLSCKTCRSGQLPCAISCNAAASSKLLQCCCLQQVAAKFQICERGPICLHKVVYSPVHPADWLTGLAAATLAKKPEPWKLQRQHPSCCCSNASPAFTPVTDVQLPAAERCSEECNNRPSSCGQVAVIN